MRKHYIDVIRVLAILLLIPFHSARIYDFYPFYIKDDESMMLQLFAIFLSQWRMPILFLVSGVGTYFILRSRSNRSFISDRLKRLLIPFIFAILVIVPPQGYYASLSKGIIPATTSYWEYYPTFFTFDLSQIDGFTGTFTPAHMWFILFLVLFSFISIAVFRFIQQKKSMVTPSTHSWLLYLLIIPIFITDISLLGMEFNPFYYFTFFLYGAYIVKEPEVERMITIERTRLLVIAIISMGAVLCLYWLHIINGLITPLILFTLLQAITTFTWIFAIIGYFKTYMNKKIEWISALNKMAFTIYILHQTLIVVIGYYLQQTSIWMWTQFILINLLTFFSIGLLYFLFIKRFTFVKILFGAK
ncbi:acyltransferase family protein [Bacillus sp. RO1]|uniref:acyltransferase family protein n=1 Tax=Bacillus sp. RO1 TaxID=2722703 RepID=UPI001456D388|nr:acyltransferase family protein [Bacillus sp. RO1]NLP49157.1 acyltransferase family protein [Bacillus sp. RO1]